MVKKLIDIFPPKKIKKQEPIIKKEILLKNKVTEISPSTPKISGVNKKYLFLGLTIILVFFGLSSLSKAQIEIYPKTEIANLNTNLKINEKLTEVSLSSLAIPGKVLENTTILTEEFTSTGKALKEEKATGIIRVYNSYSESSQVLIVNTRFVSKDGKLFRSIKKVTIPGQKIEGGEKVSGFLDIEVMADEAGEEYNIGTSTFSIPGFLGTARYTYFYGESLQPMSGGYKQEIAQKKKKDLDGARNILEKKSKEECRTELEELVLPEYILLPETVEIKIIDSGSISKAEQMSEDFIFRSRAECKTIVFKKEDVNSFVGQYISFQTEETRKVHNASIEINYDLQEINFESGSAFFSINSKAQTYSDINESVLKTALKGKTFNETKFYLTSNDKIDSVTVEFSPFWVNKVPQDDKKIEIKFNFNSSLQE